MQLTKTSHLIPQNLGQKQKKKFWQDFGEERGTRIIPIRSIVIDGHFWVDHSSSKNQKATRETASNPFPHDETFRFNPIHRGLTSVQSSWVWLENQGAVKYPQALCMMGSSFQTSFPLTNNSLLKIPQMLPFQLLFSVLRIKPWPSRLQSSTLLPSYVSSLIIF